MESTGWCIEKTSTGFFYPTGKSNLGNYAPWMASGCAGGNNLYFSGEYHVGYDIQANLTDPVYSIADGEVISISNTGWGTGNKAIFVKHRRSNGEYFLALYGHLVTNIVLREKLLAGQLIGTIGYWSTGIHLHFGILPNTSMPPNNWGRMLCDDWPSTNGFVDPINWITTYSPYVNVVGYYSDGFHTDGTSQAFVDSFTRLSPKIGQPSNNGGGIFVHLWASTYNPVYKVFAQDYQGDNQSMLILDVLNPPYKANWVKGGFCYLYRISDGPLAFGIAFTEEITHTYANSPDSQVGDPIKAGDCVTAQKFQQVYYYNNSPNAGQKKTMVWKSGIEAQHFPIGEFAIYGESCSGVCPREGDQVFVIDNAHPGVGEYLYDKPWPLDGRKITNGTTGVWFTKPGTYNFTLHNADKTRKMGWGMTVQITEGNHQFSGNNNTIDTTITVAMPQNVLATSVSETQIDLSWNGNNGVNPVVYRVYRKLSNESGESIYIGSTSSTNFTDSFLNPGTNYCYQVSASYGGLESAKSQENCATTPNFTNLNLPTADFTIDRRVVNPGALIFFYDHSTGTQISSWYWDFGDGYTSTLQNPSHRFNYSGHYDISLTVTNMYGSRTVIKRDILYVLAGSLGIEWGFTDIGSASVKGYASRDDTNGRFIIDGTGLGVDETRSQFTYMYKPYSGAVTLSTRILSQTLSGSKSMSGIMFMETASASSSYVMVAVTQGQGIIFQYKKNGIVTKIGGDYYDFPIFLKLRRCGNSFQAHYSFTNSPGDWISIGSVLMDFASDYQVGIFATSANSTGVSTAIFDSLVVSEKLDKVMNLRVN